jgi:hypothetical protein
MGQCRMVMGIATALVGPTDLVGLGPTRVDQTKVLELQETEETDRSCER